ncbi:Cap-specific mRNA (nucleoside-2'-O-)-methyltransferase 2 [Strongyloides ratti]|uniref:Cap-specific mRNA (Nucleoside-2'-O-)-methyltransferase 2 n=1 Tax=Strongyloides ratti TaxID=34506 RepID=A0A090L2Z3_STRRB|nr:Cap-specific mRNA (nucleoside-2'-O-)-methyltransferase 2 [Strongyloides ratti]CEF64171.1 Cap-specific mRNA (nucleoside-2'-O-)-methyltransferase 2 [Strongyloides ratti]
MLNFNHANILEKYYDQLENIFDKRYIFNMNIDSEEEPLNFILTKNCLIKTGENKYNVSFCTQAYLKCRELLYISHDWFYEKWKENSKIRILHLCEAPGAFVYAIHDFYEICDIKKCNPYFEWKMNSLNPFIKENELNSFKDEAGLMSKFSENMFYGSNNTGNILNFTSNDIQNLIQNECQDKQELNVLPLIEKEILIALETLNIGGLFIVKMYTFFENETQLLVIKLCQMFEKIQVVKPSCSKASNSEVYLICQNFFDEKRFIKKEKIISNIARCCEIFANYQMNAIQINMDAYDSNLLESYFAKSAINSIKSEAINQYCQKIMIPISFKK